MSNAPPLDSLGFEPCTKRQVALLPFRTLEHAASALATARGPFVLLLAADFTQPDLPLAELADRIVRAGCSYFCAWGPGCELIHDAVDEVHVVDTLDATDDDSVLMTTWHDDEPLADAVFFAVITAVPVGSFAAGCDNTILAIADRESWLHEARNAALEYLKPHAI